MRDHPLGILKFTRELPATEARSMSVDATISRDMKRKYRVFFHQGPEIGLKTHVSKGHAWVEESGLMIQGRSGTPAISVRNIREVELFRLHGTMRVIRVDHQDGRIFVSVVRFMIGQFAFVDFSKTGELQRALENLAKPL